MTFSDIDVNNIVTKTFLIKVLWQWDVVAILFLFSGLEIGVAWLLTSELINQVNQNAVLIVYK